MIFCDSLGGFMNADRYMAQGVFSQIKGPFSRLMIGANVQCHSCGGPERHCWFVACLIAASQLCVVTPEIHWGFLPSLIATLQLCVATRPLLYHWGPYYVHHTECLCYYEYSD